MLAIWVKVRVKADQKKRFLEAIEIDALGSERDEPGCLQFNVLQDDQDENVYYFYEVYKDMAALEAHRAAPHYATWRAAADTLDGGRCSGPSVSSSAGSLAAGRRCCHRSITPSGVSGNSATCRITQFERAIGVAHGLLVRIRE